MGQAFEVDVEHIEAIGRMLGRHALRVEAADPGRLPRAWFGDFAAGRDLGREAGLALETVTESMANVAGSLTTERARLRRLWDDVAGIDGDAAASLRRVGRR